MAALTTSSIAGCFSSNQKPPGLGEISLRNGHEREIEATIIAEKEGENMHEQTHLIEAYDENGGWDGVQIVEPWMGDRVHYRVKVEVPSIGTNAYSTNDFTEMFDSWDGVACFTLSASVEYENIHFAVGGSEDCPDETRQD